MAQAYPNALFAPAPHTAYIRSKLKRTHNKKTSKARLLDATLAHPRLPVVV